MHYGRNAAEPHHGSDMVCARDAEVASVEWIRKAVAVENSPSVVTVCTQGLPLILYGPGRWGGTIVDLTLSE